VHAIASAATFNAAFKPRFRILIYNPGHSNVYVLNDAKNQKNEFQKTFQKTKKGMKVNGLE